MKKIFTLLLLLASFYAKSQVVISQVYGGGGNSGAIYTNDYIELFNRGSAAVTMTGWSVQYNSATGVGAWQVTNIPTFTLQPGQYYLIQEAAGTGTPQALPTPDVTGAINMSGTTGRVVLVSTQTALPGTPCPSGSSVIDMVGFGPTVTCSEGTPTPVLTNATAAIRNSSGCVDTDNNSADFTVATPTPRNTGTPLAPCGAAVPTLSASALTAFGNVCLNTTSTANSFTITGTNLSTANVTVAALAGYTYSTTAAGTYTSALSLTQAGGSYSQQIFVKLTPTAVQSYNGNIVVGGGGASASINVAATGAGVNTIPSLTSGAATAITNSSATVAGTITATGCTAVTAYGIEYSTTAGFANGAGTPAPSSNLAGSGFTSALSGLNPGTVYYYHSYATNAGGTGYGTQGTFTTTAAPALSATALTAFGNVCLNTTTTPNSFTITGTALSTAAVTVGPLAGYTFSTTAGGTYTASLSLTQPGGSYTQQIFVELTPTAVQSYNGNIPVGGGGATVINVAASGAGVNTVPSLTAGAASSITTSSATVAGTITSNGCSAVTAYGIEYSTTAGFVNGTGTTVSSSNLSGGNFTSALSGLASGTTYYYHAYATNAGGTGYSTESSFLTQSLTPALSATSLTAFGNVCLNTTTAANSFTISGSALTTANITVGPLAGYTFSTTSAGTYTASLSLTQAGGTYSQTVYVKFTPTAVQSYNGNIPVGGGGATTVNVAASGAGINSIGAVTTGAASAITSISATLAGTVTSAGCSAITAYGVEYSTVNGFANGTGTAVASTNLAGGNYTSNVTGLAAGTVYYYHAYATNSGGTAYGAQGTFTTATPALTAGTLTAFGNVCLNTTAGPNSFTLTGTNLTTANVTVGALAGFTYATTAAGTYTTTLSLTQPGGTYSQTVFVKFTPTAVQSYNGNIPAGGGGAATVNVAASGAGVNTTATVTTGAATAITQTTATLAGTIPATGCSAITAYGIEYSTTAGFANGTGTAVPSSNLTGTGFSSPVTGLAVSTVYYYHAYATNSGGTVYGVQQSFTTAAAVLTATPLTAFGNVCINTTAGPKSFTISSNSVSAANINVAALAGYTYSLTPTGTYATTLAITHTAGIFSQIVYVNFTPTAVQSYNGNIVINGGGAGSNLNVPASGAGVNTGASVTTLDSANITRTSATLKGSINTLNSCSSVTAYGIEYTSVNNLTNGLGTKVAGTNLNLGPTGGSFSVDVNGLVQATKYFYTAYAVTTSGVSYGVKDSFTTVGIKQADLVIYSSPIFRGNMLKYTMSKIRPAHYEIMLINSIGRQVYTSEVITQLNFIDGGFIVPSYLPAGVYILELRNTNDGSFIGSKSFLLL